MTVTDKQKANLKPFVKGDKRINRKGTPRTAVIMREFIQQVGAETLKLPGANGQGGEEVTRIYALIRAMYSSKAPADRAAILKAIAPGLLRDELDITSGGEKLSDSIIQIVVHPSEDEKKPDEPTGDSTPV